jgi:hypothetical protein
VDPSQSSHTKAKSHFRDQLFNSTSQKSEERRLNLPTNDKVDQALQQDAFLRNFKM